MARNVFANWAGHFLLVISGFVLPRLINDFIGQERLGVWDFGWSAVAYLSLLTSGIGSSVNRYVAKHRATGDWDGLNRSTSTASAIFWTMSCAAVAIVAVVTIFLPSMLPDSFAPYVAEAQWVVAFLGLAVAVSMPVMVHHGVITGCQRYDLAMFAEAGGHLTIICGLIVVLSFGGGLKPMAVTVLAGRLIECILKVVISHRVCPQLRMRLGLVSRSSIKQLATFGGKYFLAQTARICLYQGNSMMVAFFIGPVALPVYARSVALILHADKFLFQFGRVLIPTASTVQAKAAAGDLRRLTLRVARYSSLLALPIVAILVVMGKPLLTVWMGESFAVLPLLPILALGHLAGLTQTGAFFTLLGIDRHGVPALAMLVAAVVSVVTSWLCLGVFGLGLMSVALSMACAVFAANALVTPIVISRIVGVSVWRYLAETIGQSLIIVAPFVLCLVTARVLFADRSLLSLGTGLGIGGLVLAVTYWHGAVPDTLKDKVRIRIRSSVPWVSRS